jgi:hypothetical protein
MVRIKTIKIPTIITIIKHSPLIKKIEGKI